MVGRRGGKSLTLALIAVFLACFVDWSGHLNRGERGVVLVVAADKKQARVIFRYVRAFLTQTPLLAPLIERETQDTLDLSNELSIEILAANYRTVRGYSLVAALLDELAFWRSDDWAANPDTEILAAIRPAMGLDPWQHAPLRKLALCKARCPLERLQTSFREAEFDAGLAGQHAHNESDDLARHNRRGDRS